MGFTTACRVGVVRFGVFASQFTTIEGAVEGADDDEVDDWA
jgi:hypothetical protein